MTANYVYHAIRCDDRATFIPFGAQGVDSVAAPLAHTQKPLAEQESRERAAVWREDDGVAVMGRPSTARRL